MINESRPERLLFLPGAGGYTSLWEPVARGLAALLPNAELVIVPGGTHDLVSERVNDVLPHIDRFLRRVLPANA